MIADLGGSQFFYIPNRRIGAEEIKAIIKKETRPLQCIYVSFTLQLLTLTQRACD